MKDDAIAVREFVADDLDAVVAFSLRAWEPVFTSLHAVLGDEIFLRLHPDWRERTWVRRHAIADPCSDSSIQAKCPRQESNLRTRFRKPLLYPLSYGGKNIDLQEFFCCEEYSIHWSGPLLSHVPSRTTQAPSRCGAIGLEPATAG